MSAVRGPGAYQPGVHPEISVFLPEEGAGEEEAEEEEEEGSFPWAGRKSVAEQGGLKTRWKTQMPNFPKSKNMPFGFTRVSALSPPWDHPGT